MNDQAETLRSLMQSRRVAEDAAVAPVMGKAASVITISECGGTSSIRFLHARLGAVLAKSGIRALLVDYATEVSATTPCFEELFDVQANRGGLVGAASGNGPWFVPQSRNLESSSLNELEETTSGMDVILVTSTPEERLPFTVYGPATANVLVISPAGSSIANAIELIKLLRQKAGISKVGVIVKDVTDGARGMETFKKLHELISRYMDANVEYLGHCEEDENIIPTVRKQKYLLNLNTERRAISSIELLGKRLKARYLGLEMEETMGSDERMIAKPLKMARYPETGNTARFWRTLLGEVKA